MRSAEWSGRKPRPSEFVQALKQQSNNGSHTVSTAGISLDGLFAQAREAIFVLNERNRIVFANRSLYDLLEISPGTSATWSGLPLDLLVPPDDMPNSKACRVERSWQQGRWLHILFLPIRGPNDQLMAVLGQVSVGSPPASIPKSAVSEISERLALWRQQQLARWGFDSLPARSPAMLRVVQQLRIAIDSQTPLVLIGEIGTGKAILAHLIHQQRLGDRGTLATLDCEALPADEQRRQLLGRLDVPDPQSTESIGILGLSGPGTLLIKSVLALSRELQREIAQMVARRSDKWQPIATERVPLEQGRADGRLDEALFHLLSPLVIELPPLRQRKEELPDHCDWVLEQLRHRKGGRAFTLDHAAMEAIRDYHWPGNLRELEAVLGQAARRAAGPQIGRNDLPLRLRRLFDAADVPTAEPEQLPSLDVVLENVERRMIRLALTVHHSNKSKAAKQLQITRARFLRRCEQLGLGDEGPFDRA